MRSMTWGSGLAALCLALALCLPVFANSPTAHSGPTMEFAQALAPPGAHNVTMIDAYTLPTVEYLSVAAAATPAPTSSEYTIFAAIVPVDVKGVVQMREPTTNTDRVPTYPLRL